MSLSCYVTACRFIWNEFTDTRMNMTSIGEITNAVTVNDCKDTCQNNPGCSSVDMTWMLKVSRCRLYPYPYNASLMNASPRVIHFVIDRSSRTIKRCFGEHDGKWMDNILNVFLKLALLVNLGFH